MLTEWVLTENYSFFCVWEIPCSNTRIKSDLVICIFTRIKIFLYYHSIINYMTNFFNFYSNYCKKNYSVIFIRKLILANSHMDKRKEWCLAARYEAAYVEIPFSSDFQILLLRNSFMVFLSFFHSYLMFGIGY